MRRLFVLAALLCACGGSDSAGSNSSSTVPASMTGTYDLTIVANCNGFLHLTDASGSLAGTYGCGGVTGTISGTFTANNADASMVMRSSGYADATMAGTYKDGTFNGAVVGSGFTGQAVIAKKQ